MSPRGKTPQTNAEGAPLEGAGPLLLTATAAAEALSISVPHMNRLIYKREIKSVKVGGSRRVPAQALKEYVERLMSDAH